MKTNDQAVRRYPFGCPAMALDPVYRQLRDREPVAQVQLPDGTAAWLVTRYDDAKRVLADQEVFSRAAADGMGGYPPLAGFLLGMDLDDHARIRQALAGAFTQRRMEHLRPAIEASADHLVRTMIDNGSPADLIAGVAVPLPLRTICELIGVPEADRAAFARWGEGFLSTTSYSPDQALAAQQEMAAYLAGLVATRRQTPTDDLYSTLLAHDAGFDDGALVIRGIELIVGGHETTASLIGSFTTYLLTHPDRWDHLAADPTRVPTAVEELLRTIPMGADDGLPRVATRDAEIGGTQIRKGDVVLIGTDSANRDTAAFDDPDHVDFTRTPNKHLAFGHGAHRCIGAALARIELQTYLTTLLTRLPGLRLAVAADDLVWREGTLLRTLRELPVTW